VVEGDISGSYYDSDSHHYSDYNAYYYDSDDDPYDDSHHYSDYNAHDDYNRNTDHDDSCCEKETLREGHHAGYP